MYCGNLVGTALLLAVALLLFLTAVGSAAPPRFTHIGGYYVFAMSDYRSDPGDRRPR